MSIKKPAKSCADLGGSTDVKSVEITLMANCSVGTCAESVGNEMRDEQKHF